MVIDDAVLLGAIATPLIGVVTFNIVAVVRGWLIPRSTHVREIQLLTDQIVTLSALMEKRVAEAITEKNEWRAASLADQAVAQEERAQKRLMLESHRATTYAIEQMRDGFEQAAKDVTHD